jgi:lipoyl(octanoyl) transferase
MAVDEAILEAVAQRQSPPTLRFYSWEPPCLSLGYAQPAVDVDTSRLERLGWQLVRRPTGGRAILHTDELTYSVIGPLSEPRLEGEIVASYRRLSQGLLRGLAVLGLDARADQQNPNGGPQKGPVCFETPSNYEITLGGRKLIGSAQMRRRGMVLQHGALPLTGDLGRICDALQFASQEERQSARNRVHTRALTLTEASGRESSWQSAADAMALGFAEALNLTFSEGNLTPAEQALAEQIEKSKYKADSWNLRA